MQFQVMDALHYEVLRLGIHELEQIQLIQTHALQYVEMRKELVQKAEMMQIPTLEMVALILELLKLAIHVQEGQALPAIHE